jgi:hypothetical protein
VVGRKGWEVLPRNRCDGLLQRTGALPRMREVANQSVGLRGTLSRQASAGCGPGAPCIGQCITALGSGLWAVKSQPPALVWPLGSEKSQPPALAWPLGSTSSESSIGLIPHALLGEMLGTESILQCIALRSSMHVQSCDRATSSRGICE